MSRESGVATRVKARIAAAEAKLPDLNHNIEDFRSRLESTQKGLAQLVLCRDGLLESIASDREMLGASTLKSPRAKKNAPILGVERESTSTITTESPRGGK